MNGYVKGEVLAKRWNVSLLQIQVLCQSGKIEGAMKFRAAWAIPESTQKPTRTGKQKPGQKPKATFEAKSTLAIENLPSGEYE